MASLDTLSMEFSDLLLPWIGVLISLVVAIWFKDFATGLAKGLKFKMNPAFQEGHEVLLDGELAMIVKIGMTETVFGIYSDRGYTWRYVPNERIPMLKLNDRNDKENGKSHVRANGRGLQISCHSCHLCHGPYRRGNFLPRPIVVLASDANGQTVLAP